MFLVDKTHLTSHFKSIRNKPNPKPKLQPQIYQQSAQSFDDKVIFHFKTLDLASDLKTISLNWMTKAVSFLSLIHVETVEQISSFRSESDCYHALYMDYSQKVLDLCNLVSSGVQRLTERRLLLNLSLRLLNSDRNSDKIPSPEKLKKAKDVLTRSVHHNQQISNEKAQRAKDLLEELTLIINKLPIGKVTNVTDLIRRNLHALGILTLFVSNVLVTVLYCESDLVQIRVPAEFRWADSVELVQKQVFDLMKVKQEKNILLLEVEDTVNRALAVCDVIDEVVVGDGDGGDERRVRLVDGVEELRTVVERFSGGVDELTNGVNGLFNGVLKRRNGVLDGVRKCDW
ncbi:hypothetical protein QVD17_32147 [Tagetes erecta]|uniref:Uncharacterized protein n=1 Tax=Tagetes erecta TaxID=13708 RepID=A0AAD8NPW0_TARER|nr:hypothetical protein QVD17_32147 [Tagetes erecta]